MNSDAMMLFAVFGMFSVPCFCFMIGVVVGVRMCGVTHER